MVYIYCYKNLKNKRRFVGQSKNIDKTQELIWYSANNVKSPLYYFPLQKAIRKDGIENFEITILDRCNESVAAARENMWIDRMKGSRERERGYNKTFDGGGFQNVDELSENEIKKIQAAIASGMDWEIVYLYFHITFQQIEQINNGELFFDEDEDYPLYNTEIHQVHDEKYKLYIAIKYSTKTLKEIAAEFNIEDDMLRNINYGICKYFDWIDKDVFPIRKYTIYEQTSFLIKKLLLTTDWKFSEIARTVGTNYWTVYKTNIGKYFYDETLSYPLRQKSVSTISGETESKVAIDTQSEIASSKE